MELSFEKRVHYSLRLGAAMCFIGHGAFGIITKAIWCNYFAVFGIGHNMAYLLMPVLGTVDILFGLILLVYPLRAVVLWLVVWAILTASLRPLSGEPFAEFIERAGNFGTPLALLLLSGNLTFKNLFSRLKPDMKANEQTLRAVVTCLKITVFLLLLGHGWLNLIGKKGLLGQYASIGFTSPGHTAEVLGLFEIVSAVIVLIRPFKFFILFLLIWKMISELLYPHYEVFEWVERGGSYCSMLALYFIVDKFPLASRLSYSGTKMAC